MPTSVSRARVLLLVVALSAYLNSLGNGFAYDDNWFIVENEMVTEGRYAEAFTEPSWPGGPEGTGNYRPIVLTSFALEWAAFGGEEFGFHAVSVVSHAVVTLLAFALLLRFLPLAGAFVGAVYFAVQPVHVEAVANVMGRSELYAAAAYLLACLLFMRARPSDALGAGLRLTALCVLYLLALGSKEIAVTLPGVLLLLELYRTSDEPLARRLRREAPTAVALAGVLACYVLVRGTVLGDLIATSPAPGLGSLTGGERFVSALAVWPHYLRLMVFPLDLAADYAPGVLLPARTVTAEVLAGVAMLAGALVCAWRLRHGARAAALGCAWFVVAVLPVSNLVIGADVLLAERTLYLPSVGAALALGGLVDAIAPRLAGAGRWALAGALAAALAAMMVRTVARNPSWSDTYSMLNTLAHEHPESWVALRGRAMGFERVGEIEEAKRMYDLALEFAPDNYQLLVDAARFEGAHGDPTRAEALLQTAIRRIPDFGRAYVDLAEQLLLRNEGRAAHTVALTGLARVGADRALWGVVAESYVLKGDFPAAIRARQASLAQEPGHVSGWRRLAELYHRVGDAAAAARAASTADSLDAGPA